MRPVRQASFCAVILAGGSGRRLGGVDKAGLRIGGVTLLERALAASEHAVDTVVVADPVETSRPVRWAREHPAGGGPLAALYAGFDALGDLAPALVAVLAVDMPVITRGTFARLLASVAGTDGAILDEQGRVQPLCAVYRSSALHRARPPQLDGLSMKALTSCLQLSRVRAVEGETHDIDTWSDLHRWEGVHA